MIVGAIGLYAAIAAILLLVQLTTTGYCDACRGPCKFTGWRTNLAVVFWLPLTIWAVIEWRVRR